MFGYATPTLPQVDEFAVQQVVEDPRKEDQVQVVPDKSYLLDMSVVQERPQNPLNTGIPAVQSFAVQSIPEAPKVRCLVKTTSEG